MKTATVAGPENVAELLKRLGGISPERVRLSPLPGLATEDDVIKAMEAPRKRLCELIDGVLVEKVMGFRESILAAYFIEVLGAFARPKRLGLVTAPDGAMRLWVSRVRMPDVGFVSWESLPGRKVPKKAIPDLAPDLAIEVLSKKNTRREMLLKREDYFKAGTRLVWEVNPRKRAVQVFTAPKQSTTLTESETLTGGDVLPGFELPLRDLFAVLDQEG